MQSEMWIICTLKISGTFNSIQNIRIHTINKVRRKRNSFFYVDGKNVVDFFATELFESVRPREDINKIPKHIFCKILVCITRFSEDIRKRTNCTFWTEIKQIPILISTTTTESKLNIKLQRFSFSHIHDCINLRGSYTKNIGRTCENNRTARILFNMCVDSFCIFVSFSSYNQRSKTSSSYKLRESVTSSNTRKSCIDVCRIFENPILWAKSTLT